jgi:hypothetical protein
VVVPTGKQRVLMFAAIAAVMLVVGMGLAYARSRTGTSNEEKEALHALIERTGPGMCEMQRRVNANDRSGALNVFYDEVHTGAHVLAAELAKTKSTEAGTFLKAKSLVEGDLRTLAPTLKQHVDAFAEELHTALEAFEPGLWTPCAA